MLFAVDVGNSHTVSGIFDKGRMVGHWRLQSRQDRTADELAIRYHGLFQMAGINPDQVDYLNAHGTSTPLGDVNETNAIKAALGDHARKIVVNSTKSMTGHLLGGAGGFESLVTVLSLHHQVSPPTANIFSQDPECDLDYCANVARDMKMDYALKNNFGFGGTNGSLVFKRV